MKYHVTTEIEIRGEISISFIYPIRIYKVEMHSVCTPMLILYNNPKTMQNPNTRDQSVITKCKIITQRSQNQCFPFATPTPSVLSR